MLNPGKRLVETAKIEPSNIFEKRLLNEGLFQELQYIIHSETFDDERNHDEILKPMPFAEEFEKSRGSVKIGKKMPTEIAVLYYEPVLSREQEHHLFRKYNFLKFESFKLLNRRVYGPGAQIRIENNLKEAVNLKRFLAKSNMRLAMNYVRKYAQATQQQRDLWAFASEANMSVMRSINCFNFTLGIKFSTYASWAMKNNVCRAKQTESSPKNYNLDYDLTELPDREHYDDKKDLRELTDGLLLHVNQRTRDIIKMYYYKGTLQQTGDANKISKERVRQIRDKGLNHIRNLIRKGVIKLDALTSFDKERVS